MSFLRRWRSAPNSSKNIDQALVLHLSKSRIPGLRQLKYVGRFLSPLERFGLYISLIVAAAGLVFISTLLYRQYIEAVPSEGGNYTEGIIGNPQYINPLYASLNDADADLEKIIFSRLFTKSANGTVVSDLADNFEVSADGKTYTIFLKDALWHNGESVTSDDVIFTFNLIQNPDYRSPLRTRFNGVSINKTDDKTVVFTLREPYRDFTRLLDFGILPADYWQSISSQTIPLAELNSKPIGSGPYKFKSLVKTKNGTVRSYVVERNESYYGAEPFLDEITFKFFASAEEMVAALNNGELNGLSYLSPDTADSIVAKNSLEYHQSALPNLAAIFFNLKSKGFIADKKVRQALAAAIDQSSIVTASAGRWGIPARSFLPEYVPGNQAIFSTDTAKTKSLLESAGWQSRDNKWFKDDKQLSIALTVSDDMKNIAEEVAKAWRSAGIETTITSQAADVIEKQVIAQKQFDVVIYSENISGGDPYPLWRSVSEANISSWSRNDVDRWLEEARLVKSDKEAAIRYQAFLAAAADDVPAIPLFWETFVYAQSKKIKGFNNTSFEDSSDRFTNVASWYTNTSRRLKKSASAKAPADK